MYAMTPGSGFLVMSVQRKLRRLARQGGGCGSGVWRGVAQADVMGLAPTAGPKYDTPDSGPKEGARGPDVDGLPWVVAPTLTRGADFRGHDLAKDLDSRLHSQSLRQNKGISSNSQP